VLYTIGKIFLRAIKYCFHIFKKTTWFEKNMSVQCHNLNFGLTCGLIKPVYNLKLKIYVHCSVVFELQIFFVVLHLAHSKPQKSLKLVLKWVRYVLLKWRGSFFGLSKDNQIEFWSSSFLVTYLYKIKCIYNIVYNNIYSKCKSRPFWRMKEKIVAP